ncbi:MAG: hypothetical protein HY236_08390 [Acidobacteria bacterium]|nr:hypothetical protein [Acidobacteriota bacterium]
MSRYNGRVGEGSVTPENPEGRQLTAAVARARGRFVANLALREAALGGTVALCGPTLLLLLGRGWFAWPLLTLFAAAGVAVVGWRLWKRRPDLYQVAQVVDLKLATADQISTAIYFLDSQEPTPREQRRAASRLATRSNLEAAFPLTMPRSACALAAVFLLASTLFALRYFLEKPLRMEQPLSRLLWPTVDGNPSERERGQDKEQAARETASHRTKSLPLQGQEMMQRGARQPGESDPGRSQTADAAENRAAARKESQSRGQDDPEGEQAQAGEALGPRGENDPIQSYEEFLEREAQSGMQKAEAKPGQDAEAGGKAEGGKKSQDASSSLLAKLREAMSQMLSKMQQKAPSSARGQQTAMGAAADKEQQEGEATGRSGQGQPQPGAQNASGDGEGNESASEDGTGQDSSMAKAGHGAESGNKKASGSGAGNQEGDKELREAQQQEALGKLTELFGKRAANITGEVTVEAQAGKQVLRTPESQKQARHGEAGGEVSRDEIPLALQPYIKEYFNKIRQTEKK